MPEPPFDSTTPNEHAASSTTPCQPNTPYSFAQNLPQTTLHESRGPAQGHGIRDGTETACNAVTAKEIILTAFEGADAQAHFQEFKSRTADAENWAGAGRGQRLTKIWQSCRPSNTDAAIYNLMVLQHLMEQGWDPTRILSKLKYFEIPPTYTAESLALLECLEKLSAQFPHALKVHRRVYSKAVEAATSAEASTSLWQDVQLLMTIRTTLQGIYSADPKVTPQAVTVARVVESKIQDHDIRESLRDIESGVHNDEQTVTRLISRAAIDSSFCPAVEQVLLCFPRNRLDLLVTSLTRSLTEKNHVILDASHKAHLSACLTVLETLDARSDLRKANYLNSAIAMLANHIFPSNVSGEMRARVLLIAAVFRVTQRTPPLAGSREEMLRLVNSFATPVPEHKEGLVFEFEETLALVLAQMSKTTTFYTPMINVVTDLFTHHAQLHRVYRFLCALDKHGLALDNASSIQALVKKQVASFPEDSASLTERQRQHHAFALRTCQNTLEVLRRVAAQDTAAALQATQEQALALQARREFTVILNRAAENNALPQAYITLTADIPSSQRTALVHQLAHHYSLMTTRSHRETWRSIYYLYVFLETQSLPIGPLFTKAVVRSSIIRPLVEHRFVSAKRLIWVCNLVARVEGERVAKQVENNYWRWRGDLIKHAKDVHVEAGGERKEKASIGRDCVSRKT